MRYRPPDRLAESDDEAAEAGGGVPEGVADLTPPSGEWVVDVPALPTDGGVVVRDLCLDGRPLAVARRRDAPGGWRPSERAVVRAARKAGADLLVVEAPEGPPTAAPADEAPLDAAIGGDPTADADTTWACRRAGLDLTADPDRFRALCREWGLRERPVALVARRTVRWFVWAGPGGAVAATCDPVTGTGAAASTAPDAPARSVEEGRMGDVWVRAPHGEVAERHADLLAA